MADVDQNCDFLLRIFSQDTTIGRTFVNIFANDNHEDLARRNFNQQYTRSEQRPSKLKKKLYFKKYLVYFIDNIFFEATNSKEYPDLDEKRLNILPMRPQSYIKNNNFLS